MNYTISFYVPEAHCEEVKQAMFDAGAGIQGNYKECAWQVLGYGQFTPVADSQPFLGKEDQLERVQEYKVEMYCEEHALKAVISALIKQHPYEVPAYNVLRNENI